VWHVSRTKEPGVARPVLGGAAAVAFGLLFTKPYLSTDLLSYLAHGRLFSDGHNPHVVPLRSFESHPYAVELRRLGWHGVHGPSPYGAPISWLERAAGSFEATTGILVFKVFVLAAFAGVAFGVYRLAQKHFSGRELATTALVVWNPSLLIETAGEGHNDIFVAAALVPFVYFAFEKRAFASGACLAFAIALKYFPAFVGLPFLVFLYREGSWKGVLRGIAGGAAALVVCALIALPLWPGLFGGVEANTHSAIYVSLSAFLVKQMPRELVERVALVALGMTIAGASFYVRSRAGFVRALFLVIVVWIFITSRQLWAW